MARKTVGKSPEYCKRAVTRRVGQPHPYRETHRDRAKGSWEIADGHRLGKRFAGEHFVAVGGEVDEAGDDDGHLLHVGFLDAFVDVHVGVVRARVVVHRILDELEAGEADGVVRKMIGAAGVTDRQSGHAEIVERNHPGIEEGRDHFIALEIDAANFAGAVVDVVVGVEFGVLWGDLDEMRGGIFCVGIAEMLLDIRAGAEEAFFFAGPEADADGAVAF